MYQERAIINSVLTQYNEAENLWIHEVMEFLEPFEESSEKLEQGRAAAPCVDVLYRAEETPCCCINRFSRTVQAQVENTGVSSEKVEHRRASQNHGLQNHNLLWPPFHHLRMLDEQGRQTVDKVQDLLVDAHMHLPEGEASTDQLDNLPQRYVRSLLS